MLGFFPLECLELGVSLATFCYGLGIVQLYSTGLDYLQLTNPLYSIVVGMIFYF